jgi:acetate kinase
MKVLVLNAGSSTVKFSLIESDGEHTLLEGTADWAAHPPRLAVKTSDGQKLQEDFPTVRSAGEAVNAFLGRLAHSRLAASHANDVAAVAHRVVHGGDAYTASVRVTPEVVARLKGLSDLAPLQNPANVDGIVAAGAAWPHLPHVAVFDTAFHATMPAAARTYAVPSTWTHDWGLRRFGFHGLSYAYCASRAAQMLGRGPAGLRLVICHLGNGASVAAVRDGVSVDTSMGFTPLEGLVMGTRSGSVDPGLLVYVLRHKGLTADDLDRVLNHESGLRGVSGVSSDMREVMTAAREGNAGAQLALDVYVHRLRQVIGAMAASAGGLDALVFTAGVGEHSAEVRAAACRELEFLGVRLDEAANASARPDADVALPSMPARVLVIATREDLTAVRETVRLLGSGGSGAS